MVLYFATYNKHKLEEVASLLPAEIQVKSLEALGIKIEIPETSGTIPGNSRQKAEFIFNKFNLACFADDSGLEVHALNNEPGVDSAFYAGPQKNFEDNVNLLLKNLSGTEQRNAQFITVITLVTAKGSWQFEGILKGKITKEKKGVGGFGYDPVFLPDGYTKTLAEMTMEEKNRISHRSIAIQKLVDFLKDNSN